LKIESNITGVSKSDRNASKYAIRGIITYNPSPFPIITAIVLL